VENEFIIKKLISTLL